MEPRGFVTSFTDSVAGTISATWGPDGQLESEQLPGGVTLSISYDPARVPVARTYTRDSDGTELWHDSVVENHRGQWIVHSATTGIVTYTYDGLGRLTSAAETLDVQSGLCTTRGYTYDAHSNRTSRSSVTATVAGTENCPDPTTDPSPTTYTYDSADRLVSTTADAGVGWTYDPWGRTTSMPTGDGASVVNAFYVNDLVASQTIAADARFTWDLDPIQRRQTNTQQTWVNGAWQESATKVAHYATDSDEPSWISEDVTDPSAVTRYVSGVEGDVAVTTSTTGDVELQLVDLHGDVVGTVPLVTEGDQTTLGDVTLTRTDEFGAPEPLAGAGAITGPPARYGWLGAAQRSSEALGGVVLMGVRMYSTITGRFLSVDPVAGGSANAYDYCNADPVNCTDLGGTFSWKGLVKAVAIVGEVASMIPGPVGTAAAAVSAVAYAVQGDKAKAIEMGVTAAANLVGCGPVVKVATRVGSAIKAGAIASRAAPRLERAVAGVKKVLGICNSFAPGTLVLLADGTVAPIETLQVGDEVWSTDTATGDSGPEPVLAPIVGQGTKHLVTITTTGAGVLDGPAAWTATANHPIWVQSVGWVHAGNVAVGDQLLAADGTTLTVTAVDDLGDLLSQSVYNLSIATTHTYYIAASNGDTALVHNAASCGLGGVYALVHPASGTVLRTGRTMNLPRRMAEHAHDFPDLNFVVLHRTDNKLAQRGLEAIADARHSPILNRIRPVALRNRRLGDYMSAARGYLRGIE